MTMPETWEYTIFDGGADFSASAAGLEASRCLQCVDAPCIQACPTLIDIPRFIKGIATGNLKGAARTIAEANIFGLACGKVCPTEVLCEGACVYNLTESQPIAIGRLQSFASAAAIDKQWQFFTGGAPSGYRVALTGAGPASLACAHALRRLGHETVIYEAKARSGGLLTEGVAAYKYPSNRALREIEAITAIGIDVRYDVQIGRDLSFEALERGFDAVFLGVGLGADRLLQLPGAACLQVKGALDWLERFKLGPKLGLGEPPARAVVIGGGNTAIDASRHLKAWGVESVHLVYRRGEESLSAYRHEVAAAREAGVTLHFYVEPVAFEGEGCLTGVQLRGTRGNKDATWTLAADLVLLAIGQNRIHAELNQIPGIEWAEGCVVVDQQTGQTGNPRYFAGGDCANGGKEVVDAVADGKRAALGIHAYLTQSDRHQTNQWETLHASC
jgi:glutamate synthase (NADPH/NADH) small chain